MPRILSSCSIVDLKRVIEASKHDPDNLPASLYKPKGRLAVAFVLLAMESGMDLEDVKDIQEVKLWDNHRLEAKVFPRVDQAKRARWKAALARPLSINSTLRRLSK